MKEEGGMQYMSPLVKQDLAKLEKDGESRRIAMDSLKHCVENLEPASVPRFLAQVSESKETGGSRSYAISLYEEVARVHGKLIIPQLPRVMATVTRSLSASGSSPQLHQACAKVVSALVRYSIDSNTSVTEAEEVVREVAQPLVEAIAGKLEPVAAGAATCVQSLVESEKWKHASAGLVSEVCQRTTAALGDKATRTVAHMQLACSLAVMNPSALSVYGPELLHAGEEILRVNSTSWKHRKCAAKMLQAVVSVVDKDKLALELNSTIEVLESFRLDKMPHVRTAVWEALQTAKMATAANDDQNKDADELLGTAPKLTPRRRSLWGSHSSLSPSTTGSEPSLKVSSPSRTGKGIDASMRRTPLFPARGQAHMQKSVALTSFSMDDDCDSYIHNSDAKENVPSQNSEMQSDAVWGGKSPLVGAFNTSLHLPSDEVEVDFQQQGEMGGKKDLESLLWISQDIVEGGVALSESPLESTIMGQSGQVGGDTSAEDEVMIAGKDAFVRSELEEGNPGNCENFLQGSLRETRVPELDTGLASQSPESMVLSVCVQSASDSCHSKPSNYIISGGSELCSMNGSIRDCASNVKDFESGVVNRRKLLMRHSSLQGGAETNLKASYGKEGYGKEGPSCTPSIQFPCASKDTQDGFSMLKPRLLITTEDFQPFATPRKLVQSLQSDLGSPLSDSNVIDQDSQPHEGVRGWIGRLSGDADMDLETSSNEGWSVMDNPIASEENCSEVEIERRQTSIHKAFHSSGKLSFVEGSSPQVVSPMPAVPCKTYSLDSGLDYARQQKNEPGSCKGDDIGTNRFTPKSLGRFREKIAADQHTCASCTELRNSDVGMGIVQNSDDIISNVTTMAVPRSKEDEQGVGECCSTFGRASAASVMGLVTKFEEGSREQEGVSTLVNLTETEKEDWGNERLHQSPIIGSARKHIMRKLSHYSEIFLSGCLVLILALLVAMVVARTLGTPAEYYPVPT